MQLQDLAPQEFQEDEIRKFGSLYVILLSRYEKITDAIPRAKQDIDECKRPGSILYFAYFKTENGHIDFLNTANEAIRNLNRSNS